MASRLSSFLAELKRRKVYHVAVAYILVGWGVSQGAEFLFGDLLRLQDVVWQVVIGLIVLAWAYEVRPEEPREVRANAEGVVVPPVAGDRKSIVVGRSLTSDDVMETLTDLFTRYGPPGHIRPHNGPEMTAKGVRD
jgi:hypothetical protein